MLSLEFPWLLLLLPVPWIIFHGVSPAKPQKQPYALKVPFFRRLQLLEKNPSISRKKTSYFYLGIFGWSLLVLSASNPRWLGDPISMPRHGRDIMLAVDVSESMEISDMLLNNQEMDRLSIVKRVANQFIQHRVGDRLGLILFGTKAYLYVPLTYDRRTVAFLLNDASIGLAGKKTAMGDALGLGLKYLLHSSKASRVLILLTDGHNTVGHVDSKKIIDLASNQGIQIYTIGIGAEHMAVPTFFGPQIVNPSAALNEPLLKALAEETGGLYFRAKEGSDLSQIYQKIDALHPVIKDTTVWRPIKNLYYWPLLAAMFICSIAIVASRSPVAPAKAGA